MTDLDRVKLSPPQKAPIFSMRYRLGFQDMNAGNHLGNEKFLVLTQEVYQSYLHSLGFTEVEDFGAGAVIASAQIQFLALGEYADQLDLSLWIVECFSKGFRIFVEINRGSQLLGRVQVDRVFIDSDTQRACACPQAFLDHFNSL